MQSGQFQHETGISALYQGVDTRTARQTGLTKVSDEALDLGARASMPHQWSVEHSPKTKGERHYNRLINSTTYLGTFAASLAGAYFFKHTKTGVRFLDPHIKKLTAHYMKNGVETTKAAQRADIAVTIGALMAGGTVPAIPFKMLEDTRIDRIKAYNEKHGTGIDDPELRELAKERVEQIPEQSNASAAIGRLSAMGLTIAFGILLPTARPIEEAQLKLAQKLPEYRLSLGKLLFNNYAEEKAIKGAEQFAAAKRHQFMGIDLDKYMVVDGTWSAFTAGILLAGSRISASLMGKENRTDDLDPNTLQTIAQRKGNMVELRALPNPHIDSAQLEGAVTRHAQELAV